MYFIRNVSSILNDKINMGSISITVIAGTWEVTASIISHEGLLLLAATLQLLLILQNWSNTIYETKHIIQYAKLKMPKTRGNRALDSRSMVLPAGHIDFWIWLRTLDLCRRPTGPGWRASCVEPSQSSASRPLLLKPDSKLCMRSKENGLSTGLSELFLESYTWQLWFLTSN